MEIGMKIGKYLKDNGIKQRFICEKTGISSSVMSAICTGRRTSVDCIDYYKICKALGVDLLTFLADGEAEL